MSVSPVYLLSVERDESIEAELHDAITEDHLRDWETQWMPALWEGIKRLDEAGVPRVRWPQSRHWNWRRKMEEVRGLLAEQGFCVVCDRVTQGLMQVSLTHTCRLAGQAGRHLVYVEYLENAPWNRAELYPPGRYRGVGSLLIRAAIQLSLDEEFKGRIGLHSLPQANGFYANSCGMTDLGPDPDQQNLRYFEMTPEQAQAFLNQGGDT